MHVHIGLVEFITFGCYLVIWKLFFHVINAKTRNSGSSTVAGVTGLLA